jgi:hypothetical protein
MLDLLRLLRISVGFLSGLPFDFDDGFIPKCRALSELHGVTTHKPYSEQNSNLLLVFVSTVVLGFGTLQDQRQYFC